MSSSKTPPKKIARFLFVVTVIPLRGLQKRKVFGQRKKAQSKHTLGQNQYAFVSPNEAPWIRWTVSLTRGLFFFFFFLNDGKTYLLRTTVHHALGLLAFVKDLAVATIDEERVTMHKHAEPAPRARFGSVLHRLHFCPSIRRCVKHPEVVKVLRKSRYQLFKSPWTVCYLGFTNRVVEATK